MSEMILARFNDNSRFTRTDAQWKYNKGQKLQINGVSLPQYFEGHFSNDVNGVSKRVLGENNIVEIPFEYFRPGRWAFVQAQPRHQGASFSIRLASPPCSRYLAEGRNTRTGRYPGQSNPVVLGVGDLCW